ncbi:MAG: hypothetical protein PSN35_04415 [Candidatus Thioglobus sp.]|uniref:hypothetical protein n=1 Tax=Candidatus Thioglobus sp. TaxID=2026721 RepID=UPI00262E00E4|nr:hypothetical protein [Candidatus Thioglobus sp.]MDC9727061.1 hypothetical protein [Candidatus Thioglobus sp.]
MRKIIAIIFTVSSLAFLSGCANSKAQIINSESESQIKVRAYQTKSYEIDKKSAVRAVISVMQDLGFVIDRADNLTGTVSGTKLDGYKISMSITIRQKGKEVSVRANAQAGIESITEPKTYQDFFTSLDKGIFLEKNNI